MDDDQPRPDDEAMSRLAMPLDPRRDHVRGDADAPVELVEYADFECPYCGLAHPIVQELERRMGQLFTFAFRHFPLAQVHPHARTAACAAEAAGAQGRFWEMHDILFDNQQHLTDRDLLAYAQALDLDIRRFVADMGSAEVAQKVRDDFMSGVRSGVNGTPTFFINGQRHDGSYQLEALAVAISRAAQSRVKERVA
jgi:protein-disulfide isomerase